jgi:hypothetical protein
MTSQALEGRVIPPSQGGRTPRTEYVYVRDEQTGRRGYRQVSYGQNGQAQRSRVPSGVPSFLGGRMIIFGSWGAAMALVTWDEWAHNNILPRPLRLWETTMVYAGLALLSVVDAMVPLANALALGYTLVLVYQFFTGGGNFGGPGV